MSASPSPAAEPIGASFRDPSGYVFRAAGTLYRRVNPVYLPAYEQLMGGGLYQDLTQRGWLIPHEEVATPEGVAGRTLRPQAVPFISYPYEWCFSQLKDAALLTLRVHAAALKHGMSLKDASAYNVQFLDGRPVFIDTLSFEPYREGAPWIAYGQFCQHFLAPLALMARRDVRLGGLLRNHIDGIPLDLTSGLLPARTWLSPSLLLNLHLHARAQKRYAGAGAETGGAPVPTRPLSKNAQLALVAGLESAVSGLEWNPVGTTWGDYYEANNNYGDAGLREKERLVTVLTAAGGYASAWDLGGNTGRFSRVVAQGGTRVVCWDIDPGCVEANYRAARRQKETRVLPLLLDLTNPSPALGWANAERDAFLDRGPVDLVLALGLVHHLAIGNNVPLDRVARLLAGAGRTALVEFIPKEDSQVRRMLASREDIFTDYTQDGFERALAGSFRIERREAIPGTVRTLYLARRLEGRS